MDRASMIKELSKGYGTSWQRKLEQMPDYQLKAVYNRAQSKKTN